MEDYNLLEDVKGKLVDALLNGYLVGKEVNEIHNEVFNMDYFVIGYYQAEQYLIQHEGVFSAIGEVQEYEKDNFGETTTDVSSREEVCNMLAYIKGEELLNSLDTIQEYWDDELTEEIQSLILEELNNL